MKKVVVSICLLYMGICFAQADDPINQVQYELVLKDNISSVTISTNKVSKTDRKLILKTQTRMCGNQSGIYLVFGDGDSIRFRDHALTCEDLGKGVYLLSGEMLLPDALYDHLSNADLREFRLGNIKIPVVYQQAENLPELLKFINQN